MSDAPREDISPEMIREDALRRRRSAEKKRKKRKRTAFLVCLGIVAAILLSIVAVAAVNRWRLHIELNGKSSEKIEVFDPYKEDGAKAWTEGTILKFIHHPQKVTVTGEVDTGKIGDYTITYSASYGTKQQASVTRTVTVEDTEAPVITLVSNPDSYTLPGHEYVEEGYSATDHYDGDLTANVTSSESNGVITYTVTDSSGNVGTATRTINYKDPNAPVITLNGDAQQTIIVGGTWTSGCTAVDDADGDVTSKVVQTGDVDVNTPGTYTVTYTVSDSSGNTATATQTITVVQLTNDENQAVNGKVIYLTFDDGPCEYTDQLLATLAKYNVHATFFTTSQFPDYLYCIQEEAAAGHTVAVHTYSHEFSQVYASTDAYWSDFNQQAAVIQQYTGQTPTIFRFPGGSSNTTSAKYCPGIMTELAAEAAQKGLTYVDWNVSSGDADGQPTADQTFQNIISGVQSHDVSFVLCHDIHKSTVDCMDETIQWCLENGYTFLPITANSPTCHHHIAN
jgi:peptidoglycan/xylan/chitin deacetylase (PgdA/CDA1 family)